VLVLVLVLALALALALEPLCVCSGGDAHFYGCKQRFTE
jgi:hypothetical protein